MANQSSIPALKTFGLTKQFESGVAVNQLSLEVKQGEIFGLLGPNGAGKSTTIQMVVGITRITSGQIEVFGHDVVNEATLTRRLTGVMHQETVIEQAYDIGRALEIHSGFYGVKDDPQWRKTLIDRLDLGPHLQKRMMRLSGGMKRRFMVAKALIHRPRLVILDEPTAGVDIEFRHSLWELVREINRDGVTFVLTTHYLEEAEQMCSRIAIMNHGSVVALDSTRNLTRLLGEQELVINFKSFIGFELSSVFKEFPYRMHPNGLSASFPIALPQDMAKIIWLATEAKLPLGEIETKRPDLEQVFVSLTREISPLQKETPLL